MKAKSLSFCFICYYTFILFSLAFKISTALLILSSTICKLFLLTVDGNWSEWSKWSKCSKTCKEGQQSRSRYCNSPAPQYGGKPCSDKAKETRVCNQHVPCPGKSLIIWVWFERVLIK